MINAMEKNGPASRADGPAPALQPLTREQLSPLTASAPGATPPAGGKTSSCGCGCGSSCDGKPEGGFWKRLSYGVRYAFGELLGDIGPWFLGGAVLAGCIGAFAPQGLLDARFGQGILPMLAMLILAVPLYVCATASTPIAAALALKGLSPGAALVFLLAGPATNAAAIAVASKILGKKAAAVYVASIMGASLVLGLLANMAFATLGLDVSSWAVSEHAESAGLASVLSALLLLGLILWNMGKAYAPKIMRRAA